jgi:hypothetical protein
MERIAKVNGIEIAYETIGSPSGWTTVDKH